MAAFDFGGLLGSNLFGGGDSGLEEYLTEEQRARMNNQGIMALAASLLKSSGPSAVPIGLGQALGEAYGAGQQGYQQAQTGAIANIMTKQKLDEFKRAKDIEDQIAKIQARTGSSMPTAGVAITPDQALLLPNMQAGPTQARANMIGQIPTAGAAVAPMSANDLQYEKYMDMSRVYSRDPVKAKAYQDLAMQLKPTEEYSTTPQYGLSAAGTPISFVLNKSGGMKLLDVQRNPEYNYQDAGGYISVRDKTTNKEVERISKTLAPSVIGSAEGGYYQVGGGGGGRAAPTAPRAPAAAAAPAAPGAAAPSRYVPSRDAATPAAAAPGVGNVPGLVPLIAGTGKAPPQAFLDKSYGIQNANDAINSFAGVIQNFTTSDSIDLSQRAQIAAAHARAILQAKELFNLGVLNGGDEKILNNVLQSPIDFSGALVPIAAIQKQAKDLQTVIQGANTNLAKVYSQKEIPLNKPVAQVANAVSTGTKAVSKSGKPIIYRNNQWEYE